jgi:hypothetical protein
MTGASPFGFSASLGASVSFLASVFLAASSFAAGFLSLSSVVFLTFFTTFFLGAASSSFALSALSSLGFSASFLESVSFFSAGSSAGASRKIYITRGAHKESVSRATSLPQYNAYMYY